MSKQVLVIGSGAFGSALTQVLVSNHHIVDVLGKDEYELLSLKETGMNAKFFGEMKLVHPIRNTFTNLNSSLSTYHYDYIFIVIPGVAVKDVVGQLLQYDLSQTVIINACKGIDEETDSSYLMYLKKHLDKTRGVVSVIGPSFAYDTFFLKPTVINVVGDDKIVCMEVKSLMENDWFKLIYNDEYNVAGLISCFKNALAIIMGYVSMKYHSNNTSSAILVYGINEIKTVLSMKLNQEIDMLNYYSLGDILLTCTDCKSRNFSFGKSIAQFGVDEALKNNKVTIEGYNNLAVVASWISSLLLTDKSLFYYFYQLIFNGQKLPDLFSYLYQN